MLEFYTNPMSRGQIARSMLEETGADYEEKLIAYGPEMKGGAYANINPMGKVPAIAHDGAVVTEVPAICTYLADAFPDAGLGPAPTARAAYHRWMFFAAGPLEQAITSRSMGWIPDEEQQRRVGFGSFELVVSVLSEHLSNSAFVAGDRFTAADVYVGGQVSFGLMFDTLPKKQELVDYAARVTDREAFRRAKARDGELIAAAQAKSG